MDKYLYEIVCPHGYVKNGFDKKKLVEYMKNIQVKHRDVETYTLEHICNEEKSKSTLFIDVGRTTREKDDILIFEVKVDENCRLENLSGNTLDVLWDYFSTIDKDGSNRHKLKFSVVNENDIKFSKKDKRIYETFKKWMIGQPDTTLF